MKFAKLSMVVAAAGLAFAAPAFAADATGAAPQKYTADNIKQICAKKKNPAACAGRRKVGDNINKRDMNVLARTK